MRTEDYLKILLENIHSTVIATVDECPVHAISKKVM